MYSSVGVEFQRGHQAYFVYPRIGDEGESDLKDVISMYDFLKKKYPDVPSALIHSRLPDDEKMSILRSFREKKLMYLVATSVIEVGIDIPDATCMVIEHAERFGLAALHQLRGRVGRSTLPSYCFLAFTSPITEEAKARLSIMKETTDGFRIAEKDLEDQKRAELLTREEEKTMLRVIETLEKFSAELKGELFIGDAAFDEVRAMFNRETDALTSMLTQTSAVLENAFRFLEDAFGESQEMVAFVTELNANYYGTWFIRENGCDLYYRYNKGLLFDERQQEIVRQMDEVEEMLNTAIRT